MGKLPYAHKHSSEKLHLVFHLQKYCQNSDAAQETLSDMIIKLYCSLAQQPVELCSEFEQHQGSQLVSFLLPKAVLAQCDSQKVLLGC